MSTAADLLNSSIGVLSFYTSDFQPLHDVTGPVKNRYCTRHGYRHIVKVGPHRADPGYYAYDRLAYIRDLLFGALPEGAGLEAILCLNGHAQIMTHSITVQSFLDTDHDFYIAADVHGLNAGVFIVRKSEWLKSWLDFLISIEHAYSGHSWHEQKAMQDNWERPEWKPRISIVPQERFMGYSHAHYNMPTTTPGEFQKGRSFTLHIPGRSVFHPEPTPLMRTRITLFSSAEVQQQIEY